MARQHNKSIMILSLLSIAFLLLSSAASNQGESEGRILPPLDPQQVLDQDLMTWENYRPIPGKNWADPSLKPERGFRLAVLAIDFPNQPFVISLPKGSDPFGNPQVDPVDREDVARFYATGTSPTERRAILTHYGVDYVWWGPAERELGQIDLAEIDRSRPLFDKDRTEIWQID